MSSIRAVALRKGKKFYSTGKPCKNGHVAMRFTVNGSCVKCQDEIAEQRNIEKREQIRTRAVSKRYQLSEEEFYKLYDDQEGECAICTRTLVLRNSDNKTMYRDFPCVDHDHGTGLVRGLLCNGCNSGIGFLMDDPDLLERARNYLINHLKKNLSTDNT
jgi:hypothetical protein